MAPITWHAMPPELNIARLLAGAGPGPMLAAAASWQALAASMEAQAAELAARLSSLAEAWTGSSSDRAIAAATPMVAWLQTTAMQATERGLRATTQAGLHTTAIASMPTLIEIAVNHITHAVLTATNFLGINTMPIGFNEIEYFVTMWTQAALAMDVYEAETTLNTLFDKIEPMMSILDPSTMTEAMQSGVTQLQGVASGVSSAMPSSEVLQATVGQVAQLSGPMQQLTQPLQQVTSLFSQMGSMGGSGGPGSGTLAADHEAAQMGLIGANPLSNHPLAGGSGASMGSGLLRGESMPGLGGAPARTPLMAGLIDKPTASVMPAAVAPGATAGTSAAGGSAPLGAMGQGTQFAGSSSRQGLVAPSPLARELNENDVDDWDDGEDW